MRSVVVISAVIPLILELTACCGSVKEEPYEETFEIVVSEEEFQSALGEDGSLSSEGCETLCTTYSYTRVQEVHSCALIETPTSETTPTPVESAGDTGGSGERSISCQATVVEECVGGRDHDCIQSRHEGFGPDEVSAWFAAQAHAESTSVAAFVTIALEIERLGLPHALVERCRIAAREEITHARILGRIADALGGRAAPIEIKPPEHRSLLAFALENAVEGCVRETWAALVAHWQASHAAEPRVRAAYARIASDEAGHADLAWLIDAELQLRLSPSERAQVEAARKGAVEALRASLSEPSAELKRTAGLPDLQRAKALLDRLDGAVWQSAA